MKKYSILGGYLAVMVVICFGVYAAFAATPRLCNEFNSATLLPFVIGMYLEQRCQVFDPPSLNPGGTAALGQTLKFAIDRTWPAEMIIVRVSVDVTTAFGQTANTITTPAARDGLAGIISKINLTVNDSIRPRSIVDVSGQGLLEYMAKAGFNLDRETLKTLQVSTATSATAAVAVGSYNIYYPIPMPPPQIGEPLRTRCFLPLHKYPQDPVLSLTYNTLTGMGYNAAGAFSGTSGQSIKTSIFLVRRLPTPASEAFLAKIPTSNGWGYLDWDLIETTYSLPLSTTAEQKLAISLPGNYTSMCVRQYRGNSTASGSSGANLVRGNVDADPTNLQSATQFNLGSEGIWRLETGLSVLRQFRWADIKALNDYSNAFTNIFDSTSGANVSPDAISTGIIYPGSTMLDFLSDSITGESGNELGSLLDCNAPNTSGLKMELIGPMGSVTVNPSVISIVGHRFLGDVATFQRY